MRAPYTAELLDEQEEREARTLATHRRNCIRWQEQYAELRKDPAYDAEFEPFGHYEDLATPFDIWQAQQPALTR